MVLSVRKSNINIVVYTVHHIQINTWLYLQLYGCNTLIRTANEPRTRLYYMIGSQVTYLHFCSDCFMWKICVYLFIYI